MSMVHTHVTSHVQGYYLVYTLTTHAWLYSFKVFHWLMMVLFMVITAVCDKVKASLSRENEYKIANYQYRFQVISTKSIRVSRNKQSTTKHCVRGCDSSAAVSRSNMCLFLLGVASVKCSILLLHAVGYVPTTSAV